MFTRGSVRIPTVFECADGYVVVLPNGRLMAKMVGADLAGGCQLHAQRDAPGRVARMIRSHDPIK